MHFTTSTFFILAGLTSMTAAAPGYKHYPIIPTAYGVCEGAFVGSFGISRLHCPRLSLTGSTRA